MANTTTLRTGTSEGAGIATLLEPGGQGAGQGEDAAFLAALGEALSAEARQLIAGMVEQHADQPEAQTIPALVEDPVEADAAAVAALLAVLAGAATAAPSSGAATQDGAEAEGMPVAKDTKAGTQQDAALRASLPRDARPDPRAVTATASARALEAATREQPVPPGSTVSTAVRAALPQWRVTPAGEQGVPAGAAVAAAAAAATSAARAAATVDQAMRTTVGTPRWAEELGSRLVLMSTRGQHEGSLTLSPEHLGPLEVRISMQHNTAQVWFGAQHADTRAALAEALPRLREMFAEAGLSLGQAGVSQEPPRRQGSDALEADASMRGDSDEAVASATAPLPVRALDSSLLDLYA